MTDIRLPQWGLLSNYTGFVTRTPQNVAAVGLTGALGPGMVAVCVPTENEQALGLTAGSGSVYSGLTYVQLEKIIAHWGDVTLASETVRGFVLNPGDVVYAPEGAPWAGGLTVFSYIPGAKDWQPNTPVEQYTLVSQFDSAGYTRGIGPLVRCWMGAANPHQPRLDWIDAPLRYQQSVDISTSAPTLPSSSLQIQLPLGANRLAINIHDNVSTSATARIVSGETGVIRLWWKLTSGQWVHNPADDFSAAGRGEADEFHDYEVYDVPRFADYFYLQSVSGNTFRYTAYASRER